jgi:type IV pilus biogenesis/stability protein PilW
LDHNGAAARRLGSLLALIVSFTLASTASARTNPARRDQAERYFRLGQVQLEQGKTMQAIESVETALKFDPENSEAHYFLGSIHYQQSEYKPAEKEFRKAIKLNAYYTDAHNHLGLVYREMKQYDKALEEFQTALKDKSYKTPEKIHLNIGHLYLARNMVPESIASFQTAVTLNPNYIRGFLGLGTAYERAGQKDLADKALRKVVALGPDSPEAVEARHLLDRKVKQAGS